MDKKEYLTLVSHLNDADHAYFVLNEAIMTDSAYDAHMRNLVAVEREHPEWLVSHSPTQRIYPGVIKPSAAVKHVFPMYSLDKIFDTALLQTTMDKVAELVESKETRWVMEPKLDGLTLDLCYIDGTLSRALTGGDGEKGEDVTLAARTIRNLPLKIPVKGKQHIRGEVCMSYAAFDELNKEKIRQGLPLLANPRNAAAGALSRQNIPEVAASRLSFVAFMMLKDPYVVGDKPPTTQVELLGKFKEWKFETHEWFKFCYLPDEVFEAVTQFELIRKGYKYPTDGVVLKLNDMDLRQKAGHTNRAPRWAYAYKYAAEQTTTELRDVVFQVGRNGVVCPVAEFTAVELAGSVISRATLHNEQRIQTLGLKIGDTIVVEKAGEIIPQVVSVHRTDPKNKPVVFIKTCPACGSELKKEIRQDGTEGAVWLCMNTKGCIEQQKGRLARFCCKDGMDIEAVGDSMIDILFAKCGVRTPFDLYTLKRESLQNIPGVGDTTINNLLSRIEASKTAGMAKLLYGLCIPDVGNTVSRKLAVCYPDINAALFAPDRMAKVPGLGKAVEQSIRTWMADVDNTFMLARMQGAGVSSKSLDYNPNASSGVFAGKIFVFTGDLPDMARDKASAIVVGNGGKATSAVSKKTTYLVVGEAPGANKLKDAQKHGTKTLSPADFFKLIEGLK